MITGKARMALRGAFLLTAVAAPLMGCASAPTTFDLLPAQPRQHSTHASLLIADPITTPPLDSDRLIVRTSPETLAYLGHVQWAERLPRLLRLRIVQSFENAHMLGNVRSPGEAADYRLQIDIRRFDLDVATHMATVELAAQIVSERSGRVIAAQIFAAETQSPATTGAAPAYALNVALGEVMARLVDWSASRI